ncbi:hypothetical protein FC756_00045 [Lysinibacillus mangiferihumi]|uniref:Uncharacterized protein n=1 Tax=Lysinibacillus mangiferihumi TaxID=1130819 RepID=A0A4U2ZEB1_9BACI|nr:hypothetical protein [Lysinibacillus mangiferihumi]TKI72724.1 hypothetical protein FC756_00045 [Lysinibacillus mangiferihumi]
MVQILTTLSAVLIIFFIIAFILTFKRSWSLNFVIWGMYLAIFFTPIFTVAGSIIYMDITDDGFAGIGFISLFVPLEIIAILMFIVGCIGLIRSKTKKQNENLSIDQTF